MTKLGLNLMNMTPKQFLPYPHIVTNCFLVITDDEDLYKSLEKDLIEFFKQADINCHNDNKTVFVLETEMNTQVCVGFYDWAIKIGFSYYKL